MSRSPLAHEPVRTTGRMAAVIFWRAVATAYPTRQRQRAMLRWLVRPGGCGDGPVLQELVKSLVRDDIVPFPCLGF